MGLNRQRHDWSEPLRICARCGKQLPLEAFGANPKLQDGLSSWCRRCHAAATAAWRQKRGEELLRVRREAYARDREAILARRRELYAARRCARKP